ncbi:unnamed protein product [Ilex paraguariensis]|uniref:Non-haem dioxygenase N-terminal domain-containing protein n=1 Tax=Ilex paraguariensis TaxID=185542 RepID=A0ABC8R236_9AQUA
MSMQSVPIIDVHNLIVGEIVHSELERHHSACREWSFFQVINHGVSASLLEDLKREIVNFFQQPLEEKTKLWQQPDNHEGFGQLYVVSAQQKLDWSDMFYITTLPPTLRKTQLFENLPPKLRSLSLSLSLSLSERHLMDILPIMWVCL